MSKSMDGPALAEANEVDRTDELASRPARRPDYAAENRALASLARELADHPAGVPQRLAELLCELCGAGSSGVNVLDTGTGDGFHWSAATGAFAGAAGSTVARRGHPADEALRRNAVVLLREPARSFAQLEGIAPPVAEALLAPWSLDGRPAGAIWVASHDPAHRFDLEDVRLLRSLAGFAAAACAAQRRAGAERELHASHAILDAAIATEAALAASEERFHALVKGFAQAVWETDADGKVVADSPSWRGFTGQSLAEWLDDGWANAVHPEDRHYALRTWREAVARTEPLNAEYRLRQAGGGWRWSNVRAAPLRNPDGSVARWIGMNIDVDARRQAEAALRESDGRFRVLAEASPALIFQFDEAGHMIYVNRRCTELLGLRAGTTLEEGWGVALHPADGARYVGAIRAAMAARQPFQQRIRACAVDGRWLWFESHGAPLFAAGGVYRGHVGISIDVTEAAQAEDALREADRRKDEFLATLAHELRNPLAPISNAVHLLRRPDGRRMADRMVEMVGRQVRQIVRLVDDLMDVSRITQGKLELRREPLSLTEVLSMAVETSMPSIDAGRHELTVSLPDETLMLDADKVRMTQVFSNMLNNAAKYTDRGGKIWLGAWREGRSVVVSVRDNGIGIPAVQLPTVFDMFSQAHRDSARGQGGLGIGLTMVRSLIEMHGGSVEARSDGPGKGTEFLVRLPLMDEACPARECAVDTGAGAPLDGRRLLVVDDNHDAAESLAMLLHCAGAEVRTVHDGPAALVAVSGFAPQAVLLDLGMPGMDGFEVARRLREDPACAGLRIIALTGWGQEEDRRRTREGGFDHHFTKPVDIDQLIDMLVREVPGAPGEGGQAAGRGGAAGV